MKLTDSQKEIAKRHSQSISLMIREYTKKEERNEVSKNKSEIQKTTSKAK